MRIFCGASKSRPIATRLHAFLQPAADARVLNVHVLDADGAAIGLAQGGEQLPEVARGRPTKNGRCRRCGPGRLPQAEIGQLQERMAGRRIAERIEPGEEMA